MTWEAHDLQNAFPSLKFLASIISTASPSLVTSQTPPEKQKQKKLNLWASTAAWLAGGCGKGGEIGMGQGGSLLAHSSLMPTDLLAQICLSN